ncbi:50S ribosomal protein L18 [Candidatus Woesearchaeota archaeon]|nr:50S ribosomal protein L18 [Candidatus Woesearchaeota archaeon]
MNQKTYTVPYRRKRDGKTNYKKRRALLMSGANRLVIRRSLKYFTAQVVGYAPGGDKIVASATSKELRALGWPFNTANTSAAYLTGLLLSMKVPADNRHAIVDLGLYAPLSKSRLFAVVKGCIDGGLSVPCSPDALPAADRISGSHIASYAKQLKASKDVYQKQFSSSIKQQADPEQITKIFESVKAAIQKATPAAAGKPAQKRQEPAQKRLDGVNSVKKQQGARS